MNFPSLTLSKIINHKRYELFEFRQLQHVIEILSYCANDFESRKVLGMSGLALFWWFGGAMPKTGQTGPTSSPLKLCKLRDFTNSKKRYLRGDPLDFTQKAPLVCEL
jgi:hypothetical protein